MLIKPAEPFPHPGQRVRSGIEPRDPGSAGVVQDGLDCLQGAAERFKVRRGRAPQIMHREPLPLLRAASLQGLPRYGPHRVKPSRR
jgi:hypothetical protein